ncbi:MAG: ribonuclease III [Proteobacteria bacterium]|nr:ribonuclease III [Pseudomonadota bacterium]
MPTKHLQQVINYRFTDERLLEAALRHRSLGSIHNERLEFLGDSVLGMVVAQTLFQQYPDASEGELTRLRAQLVRQETLATVSRRLDLGRALQLGPAAGRSGGADRSSILADTLEAVLAAIFLDSDFQTVKRVVLCLLEPELAALSSAPPEKDPKTRLQEALQGEGLSLPIYQVIETLGLPHERQFVVECAVSSAGLIAHGRGASRKAAEQEAAARAFRQLNSTQQRNA